MNKDNINQLPCNIVSSLLKSSLYFIVQLDQKLCISQFGLSLADVLGLESDAMIGLSVLDFFQKQGVRSSKTLSKTFNKALSLDPNISLITDFKKRKSRPQMTVRWNLVPIQNNQHEILGIIMIGEDVTEFQELMVRRTVLENVVNNVPYFLFWKDVDSVFLGANQLFSESAGLASSSEIEGKTDYDLPWDASESAAYIADDKAVMESGAPKLNIEETQTVDGKEIILLTSKVPLYFEDGNLMGLLGIYSDITEQKRREYELEEAKKRAEAANRAKSNFLAVVSHELRTPLNGILGIAQILLDKKLSKNMRDHIYDVEQAANNLLNLVNDILDFSRFGKDDFVVKHELFNIKEIFRGVLFESKFKIRDKNLMLECKYNEGDLPDFVVGDGFRLRQVLLNLIGNAIKFTNQGSVVFDVKIEDRQAKQIKLRFSIKDSGRGIPRNAIKNVFEKFYQVESDYRRSYEGVGLGLSICKQLVNAMGGDIAVKSTLNQGSEFYFSLPFDLSDEDLGANVRSEKFDKNVPNKFSANVLLVEDNKLNQKIESIMLESLGCKVDMANDGSEALAAMDLMQYDLIFMDVGLPGKDGLTITQEIKAIPGKQTIPIIALTAHVLDEDRRNFFNAGMDDVALKPISILEFKKILARWVPDCAIREL